MKFTVHQISHKGGRKINEDRLGYAHTQRAVLLALADGLGGHPEGAKAAEIAIRVLTQSFVAQAQPVLPQPLTFLQTNLLQAHQVIVDYADSRAMRDSPMTTLVAAVVQDGWLTALHSGDSRLYWVRQGRLLQRTRDHSYLDKPELFRSLPPGVHRSVLFSCLGADVRPRYDVFGPAELEPGDRILLCSDGLWSVLDEAALVSALHGVALREAINTLADAAVHLGGSYGDNVSLLGLEYGAALDFDAVAAERPMVAELAPGLPELPGKS